MEKEKFLAASYLVIIKEDKILLQRRQGTKLWNGFLALPAGHVDEGENAYDCLIREAKEELSIDVSLEDIIDTFVVNRRNKNLPEQYDLLPYFDVYFVLKTFKGEVKINEPKKCSELVWCDINSLPKDMIEYEVDAIKNWQQNIKFSTYD